VKKLKFITWATLSVLFFGVGCTRRTPKDAAGNPIKAWVAGVSADFPPFEFKQKGETVGYDIDVIRAIAKDMGYTVTFQDMDFSALIPAVQSGRIDIAVGVTLTEERQKNLDFSEIYFRSAYALIVNAASPIKQESDLAGKKIGVQLGTTLDKYAKAQAKNFPTLSIVELSKFPTLIQELKVNRIDGVISEEVQANQFVKTNDQKASPMRKIHLGNSQEGYAVAFAKGSALREPMNKTLHQLNDQGVLKSAYAKWIQE
jgi:ABC-type amino acid transport substrate-binding protein